MARSGMVRLGSVLVLALVAAPSQGALIRYEFSSAFLADAGPSSWWEYARDAAGPSVDLGGEFVGWRVVEPTPASEPFTPPVRGPIGPAWTPADGVYLNSFLVGAAGEVAAPSPDEVDMTATEPPLALAAFVGVAAWTFCRRRAGTRPTPPPRSRPAPARATGTAMALAGRPAATSRPLLAPRPRRLDAPAVAARPLVLPARYVEVSTRSLPARRMGAAAVSVRRRNSVRRVPA